MWQDLLIALSLVFVIEGMLPFLFPTRWRQLVQQLATVNDSSMRIMGFVSMLIGVGLLYLVK
jgi:uncharacterized protein YjeT (DUF2065 family)